jgi:hypothetical protein
MKLEIHEEKTGFSSCDLGKTCHEFSRSHMLKNSEIGVKTVNS